ncbi:DNA polymerase III subunit beta [Paenibacillus sp. CAU 1782]
MKFSIDKHILLDPLKRVASALPSKNLIPILSGILFVSDENGLSMTAGNSFIFIRETIDPDDFQSIRVGSVVLPGARMVEIVNKSGDVLDVEIKNLEVTIKSGSSKFKLMGLETEDYPEIPDVDAEPITLPAEVFKKAVKKTAFSVATDKTSAPVLTGVSFEFKDSKLRATATDRNRMSRTLIGIQSDSQFSTVISSDNLATMLKALPDGDINFRFGYSAVIAQVKGLLFYTRVLEGTFPDLDKIMKSFHATTAVVVVQDLITALENVDIVASDEKVHKVKLTLTEQIDVVAKTEAGLADASISATDITGNPITITFNIEYAVIALKSLDCKHARLCFDGPTSPITIYGVEEPDSMHLVLPYRTAG